MAMRANTNSRSDLAHPPSSSHFNRCGEGGDPATPTVGVKVLMAFCHWTTLGGGRERTERCAQVRTAASSSGVALATAGTVAAAAELAAIATGVATAVAGWEATSTRPLSSAVASAAWEASSTGSRWGDETSNGRRGGRLESIIAARQRDRFQGKDAI